MSAFSFAPGPVLELSVTVISAATIPATGGVPERLKVEVRQMFELSEPDRKAAEALSPRSRSRLTAGSTFSGKWIGPAPEVGTLHLVECSFGAYSTEEGRAGVSVRLASLGTL